MSKEKDEKLKNLQAAVDRIEKTYGKGSIIKLGDKPDTTELDVISTGSIGLDNALGVGGLPKGRVIEIYGNASAGKTSLAIHLIAECQKMGGIAAMLDVEHSFDKSYAEALGVNVNDLYISQPSSGEDCLEIAESLIRSGSIDLLIVDSVAALVPRAEIDGEHGDSKMGLHARLMSQAMRKLTGAISSNNCCCVFINQIREAFVMFGNPERVPGGHALKFYSSIRLDIRQSGPPIKDKDDNFVGNHVKVKVVKNKMAPPFKVAEFDIMYGQGISKTGEIVDYGVSLNIIQKSGSWFSYGSMKIGQGRDQAKQFMEDNPELAAEIETIIKSKINLKNEVSESIVEETD